MGYPRTAAALRRYHKARTVFESIDPTNHPIDAVVQSLGDLERSEEEVGVAFGEDTADINDPEACRRCVRPGPWLEQLVAEWETGSTGKPRNPAQALTEGRPRVSV